MPMGAKMLTEAVFRDTGLDVLLDSMKRDQGAAVSGETVALVANSLETTGISVNRIDAILDNEDVRAEYGLGATSPKSLYRTVERLGRNVDMIVSHLGRQLTTRYGVTLGNVLMDWTSMYFEAPDKGTVVRFGHIRDHRPDRPQVVVGLFVDQAKGMSVGLTVMPGNILDVTNFEETFRQLFPLAFASREAAVDHAVRTMTCGCEGIFVLLTNHPLTA